jgi:hypothetical protein
MISRKSTKTIADSYCSCFAYINSSGTNSGYRHSTVYIERLYDFLFVNDFTPWLLNAFNKISRVTPRDLQEFIMRIHTGESSFTATQQWSWEQRRVLGQQILKDLAECLIRERLDNSEFETYGHKDKDAVDRMRLSLELDGYIFRNNNLWIPEETIIDEAEEQGVLENLMISLKLSDILTLKHHLELTVIDYQESRWDDSISNSRKVLDGVLSQTAARLGSITGLDVLSSEQLDRAVDVRDYLERNKILEKKEKETIKQVYGLLSDTGGHPYIAGRDQARLMRHLALTFSQFVLLRLEGFHKDYMNTNPADTNNAV